MTVERLRKRDMKRNIGKELLLRGALPYPRSPSMITLTRRPDDIQHCQIIVGKGSAD